MKIEYTKTTRGWRSKVGNMQLTCCCKTKWECMRKSFKIMRELRNKKEP